MIRSRLVFRRFGPLVFAAAIVAGHLRAADAQNPLAEFSASIHDIARRASLSVVEVSVTGYSSTAEAAGHNPDQVARQRSNGSGVLVDPSGLIMTNAHVVQGATAVKVVLASADDATETDARASERSRTFDARIVGEDRDFDLALLRIDAGTLPALQFGDSGKLTQGDLVLAIGSPLRLRNSLSMGIVSGTSRVVSEDSPVLYIQTDASINPGNSGGALLDTSGRLIGLNTYIMSQSGGSEGIGFAIPSNVVRHVYEQLRRDGAVSRGSIGVFVQDITAPLARGLSLPAVSGVLVADVDPNSTGAVAGIQRRDVILSLDDRPVLTARQFNDALMWRASGEKASLIVQREEEKFPVTATIQRTREPVDPLVLMGPPDKSLISRIGLFCLEVDDGVMRELPELRKQYGLIVAARLPDSIAASADLQPGDVIHALNRIPIATIDAFRSRIDAFSKGDAVALQIERDGHLRYISFEIE